MIRSCFQRHCLLKDKLRVDWVLTINLPFGNIINSKPYTFYFIPEKEFYLAFRGLGLIVNNCQHALTFLYYYYNR